MGLPSIVEVEKTGDFEAVLTWVIGLRQATDFRIVELGGPVRLVIDVAHQR